MAVERKASTKGKPKIKNIVWRGEVAHARYRYKGHTYTRSLETSSARDAERKLSEFIAEIKAAKKTRTFEAAVSLLKDRVYPRLRASTRDKYTNSVAHLYDKFAGRSIESLTIGDMADFHADRLKLGMSAASIKHDFAVLSVILGTCIDDEVISANTALAYLRRATKNKQLKPKRRSRYLLPDEEAKLMAAFAARRPRHAYIACIVANLVQFIIATGLRSTEALLLRWDQITDTEVIVDAVLSSAEGDDEDDVLTKSGVGRRVPLLPKSRAALARMASLRGGRKEGLVFGRQDGTPLDRSNFCHSVAGAAKAAKLRPLTVHDLRRTCGVRLLRGQLEGIKKLRMEEVSLWLGHSSIKVTQDVYAWLEADSLHEAVE